MIVIEIGRAYQSWTPLEQVEHHKRGGARFRCRCSCGRSERVITASNLHNAVSRRCAICSTERNRVPFQPTNPDYVMPTARKEYA